VGINRIETVTVEVTDHDSEPIYRVYTEEDGSVWICSLPHGTDSLYIGDTAEPDEVVRRLHDIALALGVFASTLEKLDAS
jgi:hypothetical protein